MKKMPYGIFDYKKLKERDYYYVDKTMYLEKLENTASTLIYLRPNKFGKNLFTSMMYCYYDVNSKDKFEKLFKGTYVYDNPTKRKNNYYVLKFDFSGVVTKGENIKELESSFKECIVLGINNFLKHYELDYEINYNDDADVIIKYFLSNMADLSNKIYVLIDEYDNFTNAMLEGDTTRFRSVVGNEGIVKAFYAVIKEYIGLGLVDRFFATGICPVDLKTISGGFNIALDVSTYPNLSSMIGLTHKEVLNLLGELGLSETEKEEIYNIMIKHYDGYLFSDELSKEERVFNATLVMYLLNYYQEYRKIPKKLYDNNITVNYGKIDNLLKLQNNNFYKDVIEEILKSGEITSTLKTQFNLLEDFTREDIISLLYYFGYLTIKGSDDLDIVFTIPNEVMKMTYNNYFLKILSEDVTLDTQKSKECIKEITDTGEINKITEYVSEILKEVSGRTFIKFDEKYIELLYYSLLRNTSKFNAYTEYECTGGYIDLFISGNKEYMDADIIIEFKYIKKSDYNIDVLEEKKEKGIKELESYSKDPRLKEKVKKYLVIFVGNELKILESIN